MRETHESMATNGGPSGLLYSNAPKGGDFLWRRMPRTALDPTSASVFQCSQRRRFLWRRTPHTALDPTSGFRLKPPQLNNDKIHIKSKGLVRLSIIITELGYFDATVGVILDNLS